MGLLCFNRHLYDSDGVLISGGVRVDNSALNGGGGGVPQDRSPRGDAAAQDITGDVFVDGRLSVPWGGPLRRRGRAGRRLGWVRARREALDQPAGRQLRERGLRRGVRPRGFRAAAAEIKGGASAEDACALMRRYLPELAEDCQLEAEIARATEGLR